MTELPHFALIEDAARGAIFLMEEADGWTLPHWLPSPHPDWKAMQPLTQAVRDRLGWEVIVLVSERFDRDGLHHVICWMDALQSPPDGDGKWVSPTEASRIHLSVPAHRELIDSWCRGPAAHRAPWSRRGWFQQAADWMRETAAAVQHPLTGPVEQVRMWPGTCLLRAQAGSQHLHLKAVASPFAAEPMITQALEAEHPGQVPHVLAIDAAGRWFLLDDFGTPASIPSAAWPDAVETYSGLQLRQVSETQGLLARGCPDHRLSGLPPAIDRMLADRSTLMGSGGLTREELRTLHLRSMEMKRQLKRLACCGIPETLEHGDLHPGNVAWRCGRLFLADWSEAAVTHPFFSFHQLRQLAPDRGCGLTQAYLAPWREQFPAARVDEACSLAEALAPLYYAAAAYNFMGQLPAHGRVGYGAQIPHTLRELL
ncbi:MAG: hypothetical protein ACYCW6_30965 [Candidatus Xenobia bacterium]